MLYTFVTQPDNQCLVGPIPPASGPYLFTNLDGVTVGKYLLFATQTVNLYYLLPFAGVAPLKDGEYSLEPVL